MIKEYSAGFIVYTEENGQRKYLILHYPGGHFDFPKGHLEEGENEITAAKRELEEETGINDFEVIKGFKNHITYKFNRGSTVVSKTVTFFLCKTDQTDIKISHEHQDSFWLPFNEAIDKVTFDNAKQILFNANKYLK